MNLLGCLRQFGWYGLKSQSDELHNEVHSDFYHPEYSNPERPSYILRVTFRTDSYPVGISLSLGNIAESEMSLRHYKNIQGCPIPIIKAWVLDGASNIPNIMTQIHKNCGYKIPAI